MEALKVKNLTKVYKDFALKDISFSLPSGCIMGLIGENGAGKSTLIKLITGIAKSNGGSVEILGGDINNAEIREKIGYVPDKPCFPTYLNALEINNILKNTYKNWKEKEFFKYLDKLDIDRKKKFKDYSKGMEMKLPIAAALSHNAELLILDEATSGLDPVIRDEILETINDFTRDENHSVLMSSHILSDLEKNCDYIAYISDGRLVFCEEKDVIEDKYVILHMSEKDLGSIRNHIIGMKKNKYGAEVLVERQYAPDNLEMHRAGIEEIMVYMQSGKGVN